MQEPKSEPSRESVPRYEPEEEARIRKQLSAVASLPQRLMSNTPVRLRPARQLFDQTRARLRSGQWHEEQRLYCKSEDGFPAPLALVTDETGRVRAYTVLWGGEDSAGEIRHWFDEQERQRLMIYLRYDVEDGHQEHIVLLDAEGRVVACDRRIVHKGGYELDLCSDDDPDDPDVDPAVRDVTASPSASSPKRLPKNELRDRLLEVDPRTTWSTCLER